MESSTANGAQVGNPEASRSPRAGYGSGKRGGARGERGRGGARGRGRDGQAQSTRPSRNNTAKAHGTPSEGTHAAPATAVQQTTSAEAEPRSEQDSESAVDDEAEVCFICASPVVHSSIAPCNHRTCHICALRLRALYKTNSCAHCRTNAEFVIFTDTPDRRFEQWKPEEFQKSDDNLGIKYEKNEIYEDTVLLLRYNCPDPSCDVACYGWPDLHRHVRNVHHKVMCDLCTRNKKVFTHEHELFTKSSLAKHERYGDDNPGAVDQSGFKGHPECGFCRQRFYGDDELYAHCRDKHERCHICDRREGGRQQQYYLDYNALELHYSKDHFLCPDKECLEKKFVVFESEMDLKAHQLEAHPNGLTKDARRDARHVDMSQFDYRSGHQQNERRGGGRRERRGGGPGRDPNVEGPIPVSSAQPMRRDEIAYQRQLAIHSAQSVSNRTFGGQLTSNDAVTARAPPNTREPQTVTAPRSGRARSPQATPSTTTSLPDINGLDISTGPTLPPAHLQTPQDRARALRHAAITERASNLLSADAAKLSTFRTKVSAYKNGALGATGLIDTFFSLFACPTGELGTLIKELADAFEVPGKRDALLAAWNDWRAINEDYPSLPGQQAAAPAPGAGKRILKLKSSTAQSSRSAVSRHGSWGSSTSASTTGGPATAFPGLPSSGRGAAQRSNAVPWVKPASSASASASARASPAPSRAASRPPPASGADMFPALPAAQKPGMNATRPGYLGNPVRREGVESGTGTPVNAWGSGGGNPLEAVGAALEQSAAAAADEGGKRKGKKKQTLIHWG